jgi:hypothetical protein
MDNFIQFFYDILTILKLVIFAVYSIGETLLKCFFIPQKFLAKSVKGEIVLITGAGYSN